MKTIKEPAREVPIVREVDVVVLGGGPAGLGASTAAARAGYSTLLVERYGFLGGNGTAAMVTNFCGLFATVGGSSRRVVHGIADTLLSTLKGLDGLNEPQAVGSVVVQSYDNAIFKYAADRVCADYKVDGLFHVLGVGAVCEDDHVRALIVESKSGRAAIQARFFIDCSGDADLVAWCGEDFEKGGPDGYLAFPTMMFRMAGVDNGRAENEGLPVLREKVKEAHARGEYGFVRSSPITRPQAHPGEWRMNMTQVTLDGGPLDGTNVDHLSRGERLGREQAVRASQFLQKEIPGFERSYLIEIAPQLGIRETRRLVGKYALTGEDVLAGRRFEDVVACSGWPIEQHVLGGVRWQSVGGVGYYDIPFRCLVPRRLKNLLVAGRCLSATQNAQSSARVSATCLAMGEAAGTAAALCLEGSCTPEELDIAKLQQSLRERGAFLGDAR